VIPRAKLEDYLLNSSHRHGAGKARFFLARGFRRDEYLQLDFALRTHVNTAREVLVRRDREALKRVFECFMTCPDGTRPCVRSVWLGLLGTAELRLITAYPADPPA
jgi:hypothetical protein